MIFKMFRVLRPLRLISRNNGLKTAVVALFMAIPNIISIITIVLLFFLIFGIIGVNYFKGTFFYCIAGGSSLISLSIDSKWNCYNLGGLWVN